MKKKTHLGKYWAALMVAKEFNRLNREWIAENLCMVDIPPLVLYLADGDTKVWVTNDTLVGLSFHDPDYANPLEVPGNARMGELSELSEIGIATLRDHMDEHWNNPASKRIRAARESISALMDGSAGEHPAVKALSGIAAALQAT